MRTYTEHYEACKHQYKLQNPNLEESKYKDLHDLRLDTDIFPKNEKYYQIVNAVSKAVNEKIENKDDLVENPWAIHLNSWAEIGEIHDLFNFIMPYIEEKVFKSNAQIEHLHVYRNKQGADPDSSWIWHYDDCPNEFLKLVLYLKDVTEDSGSFQYLESDDGHFPMVPTNRTYPGHTGFPFYFPNKRIPIAEVDKRIEEGCKLKNLTGKVGTYALMSPNIYHRATVPSEEAEPRECLFFFIRPALRKRSSYSVGIHSIKGEVNVKMYPLD